MTYPKLCNGMWEKRDGSGENAPFERKSEKHWEKVRNTGLLCGDTVEDVAWTPVLAQQYPTNTPPLPHSPTATPHTHLAPLNSYPPLPSPPSLCHARSFLAKGLPFVDKGIRISGRSRASAWSWQVLKTYSLPIAVTMHPSHVHSKQWWCQWISRQSWSLPRTI